MSDNKFTDGVLGLRLLAAAAIVVGKELEAPAHPDAELLKACATYLDLCADARAIERETRKQPGPYVGNPQFDAGRDRWKEKDAEAKRILNRLGKTRASTAAGVYAKATIVVTRRGYMSAPNFMLSLADDLVNCPGLRAAIWPVTMEGK